MGTKCPTVKKMDHGNPSGKINAQYIQWETKLSHSRQVTHKTERDQKKSQFTVGSQFCLEKLLHRKKK